jgi:hypothetical protein
MTADAVGSVEGPAQGWRSSGRSYGTGQCVQVAGPAPDHIRVRDSKNPQGLVLQVTQVGWTTFLGDIRGGKVPHN